MVRVMEHLKCIVKVDATVRGLEDWKSTQADTKWNQDKLRKRWCYLGHFANKDPDTTSYHEMKIIWIMYLVLIIIQKDPQGEAHE